MRLLTADIVKSETNRRIDDQKERVSKMAREESEMALAISNLRESVKDESKRAAEEINRHRSLVLSTKAELESEVTRLEDRKRDALKPILEIKSEAERLLASALIKKSELEKREMMTEIGEKRLESERNLIRDEKKAGEDALKKVTKDLEKWQADLSRQNHELKETEKSLLKREKDLDKRDLEIDKKAQDLRKFSIKMDNKVQQELNKARRMLEISKK